MKSSIFKQKLISLLVSLHAMPRNFSYNNKNKTMKIYPKDYFETKPNIAEGTCFVIMPFASDFDDVFTVIKNAAESEVTQLQCKRGDNFLKPHILITILENLSRAEYIIADLTGQNPNVFYELGLAHCVKDMENLILISQDPESIPFDLRQYRYILYDKSPSGFTKLEIDIIKTLQEDIGNQYIFSIEESHTIPFSNRFSGEDRYVYEIQIWLPFVAVDSVKTQIYFTKCKSDGSKEKQPDQDLYIETGKQEKLDHIPWTIRLLAVSDKKAKFILRKSSC
jgi:hypothetical protein